MSLGRDALLGAATLCGIPAYFPSMPLASECTVADENSPDPHRNSVSPLSFLSMKASMAVHLRETPSEARFSSGKYQESSYRGYRDRRINPCHLTARGVQANIHHVSSPRGCDLAGNGAEHCSTGQQLRSPVSSEHTCDSASNESKHEIFSGVSDGSGSDDGVEVYIDETDEDVSDGLLITECRISSRKAAEIRAFKAQWVEQMLLKKEQLLSPSLVKGAATGGRRRTCSASGETNGHEAVAVAQWGSGLEFLESKLRAFAACMMPEALECIRRNAKRWVEASSDFSESDSSDSPRASSRCTRVRHVKVSSATSPSFGRWPPVPSNQHAPTPAKEMQQQLAYSREHQQCAAAADVALHSWGHFLKYIRKTSGVLPSRQRVERNAGLESDDDDEQAPLYMCRPGSVQRPSPLISHSLTEHLKASGTMFFKHFHRQCLVASASATLDASGVARTQPQPSNAVRDYCVSASTVVHTSPANKLAAAKVNHDERKRHSQPDIEGAVPLYEISAKTSALFGDMMRLEDTARMLDASCTFRLPAAPSSIVRSKKWKPTARVEAAHLCSGSSAPSSGVAGLCSAATAESPATAATAPTLSSQQRHVTLYTSPHAATAAALSQLIANCRTEKSLETQARKHIPCSDAAGGSYLKPEESSFDAKEHGGSDSSVVYTVQADEDTLALSGLDAEYCARVESASRGRNRAADSLAHLERMQFNGTAVHGNAPYAAAHKKKRKAPTENNVVSSDDGESGSERYPHGEGTSGAACRAEAAEDANYQRSLMVDKLMLAHLMPYLPQFGPP